VYDARVNLGLKNRGVNWPRAAAIGLGLAVGAFAAASGCGARSELYLGGGAVEEDAGPADGAADALPDVPVSGAFCAEATYDSGPTDLSMFVLLDRSGSMADDNRWAAVTSALSAFVDDPAAEGLGIGLQYYPLQNTCVLDDYAVPAVPIAKLPDNGPAIKEALAQVGPYGETPTLPALRGGVLYARGVAIANPKERVVIALVTDGAPNACESTAQNVAEAEQAALATDPKILTYVIGLATGLTNEITLMASAGGTGKPILVDDGASAAQKIVDAMLAVKLAQENCTFGVPIPAGTAPAATDLSVRYRTSPGAMPVELPIVADFASCTGDAYYPDDVEAPGSVTLCPATCGKVHAADKSVVTVTAGCGMGNDAGLPDASPDATSCGTMVDFSCLPSCGSNDLSAPACIDGAWTCPPGTINSKKCTVCPDIPHGCCHGELELVPASCVNGAWTCPPGDILYGQPGCTPPEVCDATLPCAFGSYCDIPDDSCGKGIYHGSCKPKPVSCPAAPPQVCGCNNKHFPNACLAAAEGIDVDGNTACSPLIGKFPCGGYYCDVGSEVCRKTTVLGDPIPDTYACVTIPSGCGNGCSCELCDVCPPNGPCGTCGPDGPEGGVYLQCTSIAP
jgi:hypothetical protein